MSERILRGSTAIARALGVSAKTVQRWAAAGLLPVVKFGARTSPLCLSRSDLARIKRDLGRAD